MEGNASQIIGREVQAAVLNLCMEVKSRAHRSANELKNASQYVLRGERSGRVYKIPYTSGKTGKGAKTLKKHYTGKDGKPRKPRGGQLYRASAPGEAPANRLGTFRISWKTRVGAKKQGKTFRVVCSIESTVRAGGYLLGEMLEEGTSRMEPRPYKQAIKDMAMPKITAIYDELGR